MAPRVAVLANWMALMRIPARFVLIEYLLRVFGKACGPIAGRVLPCPMIWHVLCCTEHAGRQS